MVAAGVSIWGAMQKKAPLVVLAFAAVSVIWGSTYLGIRIALESFPPFLLGAIRFVLAGGLLFGWARLRGEPLPSAIEWRSAAVTGTRSPGRAR